VFHIWPEGMTPSEEAELTVQAYLSDLRSRWPKLLVGLVLKLLTGLVLLGGITIAIRYLFHWMGVSFP
jgi:hypothetical protein